MAREAIDEIIMMCPNCGENEYNLVQYLCTCCGYDK